MKNIENYREQATKNNSKSVAQLLINDFVYLRCSGLKNDCSLQKQIFYADEKTHQAICKIVEIMHISDKSLEDGDYLPENTGGSCSEDLPDNANEYNLTSEQIDTFYQCVTLVITDKGRYVFVDRQGYDYCRYMYLWSDFRTMYATEIKAEKAYRQRLKEDAKNERKLKYTQICEKFRSRYPYLIEGAEAPKNFRLLLKKEFPNAKFSVTTRQWGEIIRIQSPNEVAKQVHELIKEIESYDNGVFYYNAENETCIKRPFEDLFGAYRTISVETY